MILVMKPIMSLISDDGNNVDHGFGDETDTELDFR